ncbi:Hypothetical predicted protein [Paramuricea clavata]|uniref:DUF7869 domain-containing protein n=1 Tax=Paramuricea clavata TaxID=317549 RepID=A0A6S7IAC3_PARCT|nr:Hypothetical predicted protein [Paramuricea clavata]
MSFQPSVATNCRLVYSPDCNSSSKQNCGLPQSGTIQKLSKENNVETLTKIKNKQRLPKLSFKSVAKVQGKHCCCKKCLPGGETGLSKSDIMACRKEFWKLDENEQWNYILTFFHTNAIKSSGRQQRHESLPIYLAKWQAKPSGFISLVSFLTEITALILCLNYSTKEVETAQCPQQGRKKKILPPRKEKHFKSKEIFKSYCGRNGPRKNPSSTLPPKIEKGSSGFLPMYITGVLAHGQDLKFCFVDLLKWPADANTTFNVILAVLKFIKEKVKLSYLMVGHTHEDVDQMFSSISATLGRQSAHTLQSHASFTPDPITADLSTIWDVKSWLQPYNPALKKHSRHHSFRFQKGKGKYAEHIEMCYRNWSKCKWKEWPPTKPEDIIRTLDVVPTGSPSILRPVYSKCPSVDDMRSGDYSNSAPDFLLTNRIGC